MKGTTTRPAPLVLGLLLGAGAVLGGRALIGSVAPEGATTPLIVPAAAEEVARVMPAAPAAAALPERQPVKAVEALVQPDPPDPPESQHTSVLPDRPAGILVHGLLTDGAGAVRKLPLGSDNELSFTDDAGFVRTAHLEPSGTYAISGLPPGEWRVHLVAHGCQPLDRSLTLTADEPVRRCDFVVETALTLLVSAFTPDGAPLRDVLEEQMPRRPFPPDLAVVATREAPAAELPMPPSGFEHYGIGRFRDGARFRMPEPDLPRGALGRLELHEPLPAFVSLLFRGVVLGTQAVEPGSEAITFTVPRNFLESRRGGLRVRVVDAVTAAPLTEARALLTETNVFAFDGGVAPDATGTFSWQAEPPGARRLQIDCKGHEQWVATVNVPVADTADLGTVALDAAAHISGVVRDAQGVPQSAMLQLMRTDGPIPVRVENMNILSNEDGAFRYDNLGRREYEVGILEQARMARPVRVSTRAGDVDGVVVVVEHGTEVSLEPQWSAARQLDVEIRSSAGESSMARTAMRGDESMTWQMLAGDYKAFLFDGPQLVREIPFHVEGERAMVALVP